MKACIPADSGRPLLHDTTHEDCWLGGSIAEHVPTKTHHTVTCGTHINKGPLLPLLPPRGEVQTGMDRILQVILAPKWGCLLGTGC